MSMSKRTPSDLVKTFSTIQQINREYENAALVIQKYFRGFTCRKIIKEKFRIDNEFRILRQKYEIKSMNSQS